MDAQTLHTTSLREHPLGRAVTRMLSDALIVVDPHRLIAQTVAWTPAGLRMGDRVHGVPAHGRIFVAGAGKAGRGMAEALALALDDRIADGTIAIKAQHESRPQAVGSIRIVPSGHPLPDHRSVDAGRRLLALARGAGPDDIVLCPISGGASALVTVPAGDLTLEDLRTVTDALLRSGADIRALNGVRKHLDVIKGGGLALAAAPASVVSLVISDVVGDALDVIASGPTVGDGSTFDDAWKVVHAAMDPRAIPHRVARWLEAGRSGARPETPAPDDPRLASVCHLLLAGNGTAVEAAIACAEAQSVRVVGRHLLEGEAALAGRALARRVAELRGARPACIVAGGETTVTLRGDGIGGRNLELALAAVEPLASMPGALLVTLATDGDDGPSGAAGAVVTADTLARARAQGLDPRDHLARNDSLAFFDALGDTIRTGPTGTNVCDLAILSWTPPPAPASS